MARKVLSVVGARPQFIKAAMVSTALRNQGLTEVFVHTGQHYDYSMSDIFFKQLELPPPAYHLGIGGLLAGAATGRMMEELEKLMMAEKPDAVIVYGDTNSTLAGALSSAKLHIPIAHIEGGMRSYNRRMPEEINRVVTDHLSSFHFLTSQRPADWLKQEGITKGVHIVGDVMFDAVKKFSTIAPSRVDLKTWAVAPKAYGLVTVHRAENTDDKSRLKNLFDGLIAVSEHLELILPMHPRTRKAVADLGLPALPSRLRMVDPVGYFEMLVLEMNASMILTDSGGVQKEAFFSDVPCITLRDETEWIETVELGWNKLVGCEANRILEASLGFLRQAPKGPAPKVYGDGSASDRIVKILREA